MGLKAITFFSLLLEATKSEVRQKQWDLVVASYHEFDREQRQDMRRLLMLPEDILRDIMPEESGEEEKEAFKQALNGN